jgi:60 kDa SS-A/Ro ribonucleoprotein
MAYTKHFNAKKTPQNQKTPGKNQHKNNAGGYVYKITPWERLERFLILGSEGGSYYVGERKLTVDNAQGVIACLKEDGRRAVDMIVEVSDKGRAAKNTPALFALALAASADDAEVRKYALDNLHKVARIGTHLFQFAQFVSAFRGWGRGLREAFGNWYTEKDAAKLAYQIVKYPQRRTEEGDNLSAWSHRDILRKAHPKASGDTDKILRYATQGWDSIPSRTPKALSIIRGAEKVKRAKTAGEVADLVTEFSLPHEVVPKEFSGDPLVMKALLENMPLTATMRNLGRMTSRGVLVPMGEETDMVIERLTDAEYIRKSRIHPINVLAALRTYSQGGGYLGNMTWSPIQPIVDALDNMLYKSFENIEPTGKKILIALDISGSMGCPCMGMQQITSMEASAVMAMATARSESKYHIVGFTSGGWKSAGTGDRYGWGSGLTELRISPRQRLDSVLKTMREQRMGGTDCALPMLYATEKGLDVDAFVVYTDSETWAGNIKPDQALNEYRRKVNPEAKLVVAGTASTEFSIADPQDPGMLDVVGFDSSAPSVIANFIRGMSD